jgi:hypothetical protein
MEDHGLCVCDVCAGKINMEGLKEKEAEMIEQYGFFTHFVFDVGHKFANYHTHGFQKTWEHNDFQIVLPLAHETAQGIFWNLAHRVKDGDRFSDGQDVDKIINGLLVRLMKARDAGRDVLRILIPDENGLFPGDDGVAPIYAVQDTAEGIEPDLFDLR